MLKTSAIFLLVAMVFTLAAQVHPRPAAKPAGPLILPVHHRATGAGDRLETLDAYYSPLPSTAVIRYLGFGLAYHMALVYSDRTGTSYGASSGPSDLSAPQTPANAAQALVAVATDEPSTFGVIVSDPLNDTPFVIGTEGDHYTRGRDGFYPHASMLKGADLSAQWTVILQTYALVGSEHLAYSPTTQNSNSLAGTALRRVGVDPTVSNGTVFTPGLVTELPLPQTSHPDRPAPDSGFLPPTAATGDPAAQSGSTVM